MADNLIYKDILSRTNGDIYVGVVGPVRTGKSTFISNFMKLMVLPEIEGGTRKQRIVDELPQSSDGKVIMTTQPKFVPDEAVRIKLCDGEANIRLIDCVGYPYDGIEGFLDDGKERNILTPWDDKEMPFTKAAIVGTNKVINDHSTIGIVITNDGSLLNVSRDEIEKAEEEIIDEMKKTNKPFIILLNSKKPHSEKSIELCKSLEEKYNITCVCLDVKNMTIKDIQDLFSNILLQFPILSIDFEIPKYMQSLSLKSEIIANILAKIRNSISNIDTMKDIKNIKNIFDDDEYLTNDINIDMDYGNGKCVIKLNPKEELFYKVLSMQSGENINNEYELVSYIKDLAVAKSNYEKFKIALEEVENFGYGIVNPRIDDLELEEPEIAKKGSKSAIKLRASASSYHIIKVDVETEVNPLIGGENQNEQMLQDWIDSFGDDVEKIWETNMLGKSLNELALDGLNRKVQNVPDDVRLKLRKTLTKISNDGKGGVLCVLL